MNQAATWTSFYLKTPVSYPAEAVIRIFKGQYPNLKMKKPHLGDIAVDVGCGDGRHLQLFRSLGMESVGIEITQAICDSVAKNIRADQYTRLAVGTNDNIPLDNEYADYVLSWNSCYYMGVGSGNFEDNVIEMARILKPGGALIVSVPQPSCFIFEDIDFDKCFGDYVQIRSEYFGLRAGETMRFFGTRDEFADAFSGNFDNFCHSSIDIDCFGLRYSWWVLVAQKK
jgi:SAM-dependent methyltransferase